MADTKQPYDWEWDKADDKVEEALEDLRNLFYCFDKIYLNQFGFILFYLPVYVVMKEILGDKLKSKLEIINHGSDIECLKEAYSSPLVPDSPDSLNFFLAEPPSSIYEYAKEDYKKALGIRNDDINPKETFTEIPFVTVFPLWGVSLAGNPRVSYFLKDKLQSLEGLPRIPYWENFVNELGMLTRKDLKRLIIGVFSTNSTTYYAVKGQEANLMAATFNSSKGEDEFTLLFREIVDVALTFQPWKCLRRSDERVLPKDPLISYVHRWEHDRMPASALYFRSDKKEETFTKAVAKYFHIVLRHVCNKLSMEATLDNLDALARDYCNFLGEYLNKHNCLKSCKECQSQSADKCLQESALGIQSCISSRVFKVPYMDKESVIRDIFTEWGHTLAHGG